MAFEFADDGGSDNSGPAVTMSSADGAEMLHWGAADDDPRGGGGRVAFVGLSAEPDDGGAGFVGARFRAEGIETIDRAETSDLVRRDPRGSACA